MVIFVSIFILRRKFQVLDVITNISFFKSYSPGIKYILRSAQRSSENVLQRVIAFQTLSKRFCKIMHGIAAAIGKNILERLRPKLFSKVFLTVFTAVTGDMVVYLGVNCFTLISDWLSCYSPSDR